MTREVIATPNAPAAIGPYSQAIKANGFVFVSGQGPLIPGTKQFAGETVTAQTEQVLKNIAAILQAAGTDMAHVVKVMVLLADMATVCRDERRLQPVFPGESPRPARPLPLRTCR